jgi:chorismate mutase
MSLSGVAAAAAAKRRERERWSSVNVKESDKMSLAEARSPPTAADLVACVCAHVIILFPAAAVTRRESWRLMKADA